jgi:hypothetical protein
MKKSILIVGTVVTLIALLVGTSVVMAAKPQKNGAGKDVITLSNGFPSGAHYNLNIHGKSESYVCIPYDPDALDHNVVNIPEIGEGTISYVSGKKVKINELTVFDACTETFSDDNSPAEVWIPYEAEGYWVFARALGKPAKGNPADKDYVARSIIIENAEYSPITYSLFGDVTNPDEVPLMLPLGLITQGGDYKVDSTDEAGGINLVRFDSEPDGKGRGKTLGKDFTDMFLWTGWVFQPVLDTDGDGDVDYDDVPISYDDPANGGDDSGSIDTDEEFQNWLDDNQFGWVFPTDPALDLNGDGTVNYLDVEYTCWSDYDYDEDGIIEDSDLQMTIPADQNSDGVIDRADLALYAPCIYDLNGDGYIDPFDGTWDETTGEFENWLEDMMEGDQVASDFYLDLWEHYETPIWVFNVADLVYHDQVYYNDGIKNLQIRFYPVATTDFVQKNRIVVDKITAPPGSAQSFEFTLDGPEGFHDEFSLTDGAPPYVSINLQPGEYTLTETVVIGWNVASIDPDDENSTVDLPSAKATIILDENERVTVTFTNNSEAAP